VGVDTIRYYERLGVLPAAPRRSSGYRVFDETTVERIKLVKQLQDLGLTLHEIESMLRAIGNLDASCAEESTKISAALARTDEKIAALMATRNKLKLALRRCTRGECSIVEQVAKVNRRVAPVSPREP
jgi:DNA-binding transcriptional MerR regulator